MSDKAASAGQSTRTQRYDGPLELLINGEWTQAEDTQTFVVDDPSSGQAVATMADASVADALTALDHAVDAQKAWGALAAGPRQRLLRQAADNVEAAGAELAATMALEAGKPLPEAHGEVGASVAYIRWYVDQIGHTPGHLARSLNGEWDMQTVYRPVGPCLLISPWNFPLLVAARKLAAALSAGCTALVKPAGLTPLTSAVLVRCFVEAGLPAGVIGFLPTTRDADISEALMADARLRKVSFTGSTRVGSILMRQAATHVQGSQMELGGNGPLIVLDDADLDLAVEQTMIAKFRNAGQVCIGANRLILQDSIADEFLEKFVKAASNLAPGSPFETGTTMGPLISSAQRDRAVSIIRQFVAAGGEVLYGGSALERPGHFMEPTVITGVGVECELAGEELFAPIAVAYRVADDRAAIDFANAVDHGLSAYVFSGDLGRALQVADEVEAGMVAINRALYTDPSGPFGGVKASGMGREGGHEAIYEFLESKLIAARLH